MSGLVCWVEIHHHRDDAIKIGTAVVFAATESDAMAAAAKYHGWNPETEPVHGVRRAPEFDAHAPGPVPAEALLDAGWHIRCADCGRTLDSDSEDEETGEPLALQFSGEDVFCSVDHYENLLEVQRRNREKRT